MPRFQLVDAILRCRSDDREVDANAHLEGHYVLVVHAGSIAKGDGLRDERFLKQGVVEPFGTGYRFKVDFPFVSPTDATTYLFGVPKGKGRGWDRFITDSGQTLRQLFAAGDWDWLISK